MYAPSLTGWLHLRGRAIDPSPPGANGAWTSDAFGARQVVALAQFHAVVA
jgi:hypothetical protein